MKDKLKKDLFEQRTKEWDDYYNRPSLRTSYQIAVWAILGMILVIFATLISEVV